MKYFYYILENSYSTNKQGLKVGVRIQKIPVHIKIEFKNGEGPFENLEILKKRSTIYRNIVLRNTKRAQQICLEKNIQIIKDWILTKEDFSVSQDFIEIIEHCIKGSVKKGKISGVHYYDSEKVKIIRVLDENKSTGIWEAEIEFYDKETEKWYKKEKSTTFFPKTWSLTQLFHECSFAIINKIIKKDSKNIHTSKTESGINVEIVIINGKMISIYPLIQ